MMGPSSMRRTIALLVLCLAAVAAQQAPTLVIFGDSLTDTGPRATGGGYMKWMQETLQKDLEFPSYPYATGRYSNGPVWPEYVAQDIGIEFINWAAGGATSGAGISQAGALPAALVGANADLRVLAPNLEQQRDQFFLSTNNTVDPNNVYLIFMGNNDYFSIFNDGVNITADEVVGHISDLFEELYDRGARKFIVVNIPPVAALPPLFLSNQAFVDAWSEHNELLASTFADFNETHTGAQFYSFDFASLVLQVAVKADAYGFTNITGPCLVTRSASFAIANGLAGCSNPDQHLFWDTEHPTTAAHKIIGSAFAAQFGPVFGELYMPTLPGGPATAPAASNAGRKLKLVI